MNRVCATPAEGACACVCDERMSLHLDIVKQVAAGGSRRRSRDWFVEVSYRVMHRTIGGDGRI